jgi:hypothetical protein
MYKFIFSQMFSYDVNLGLYRISSYIVKGSDDGV